MADSIKQFCRLCLEMIPICECNTIDKIKKDILEVLLIYIDFDISDSAVACNTCLERLQDCFDFKSHITTFMDVEIKTDIKKEMMSNKNIYLENSQICVLCMSLIEDQTSNYTSEGKNGVHLKDVIRDCLPEVDLNTISEHLTCKPCVNSLKSYYEFRKWCQEVEQRIKHYYQVACGDTIGKVILEDMLKFKDCEVPRKHIIHKKKSLEIECDEVDIEDELDSGEDMIDSQQSESYDNLGKDGFLKTKTRVGESGRKGKKYFCPKCPHSSGKSKYIKVHMRTHSDNESHKCFLCPFITDNKFSLKKHMTSHRGATKAYGCPECSYETDNRTKCRRHILIHKDESEVKINKCSLCPFRTKHKHNLVTHQLVHLNPKEIPMYKCAKCKYETKYKSSLIVHLKKHQDPDMVNEFKCDKYPFPASSQHNVKKHMMVHSDKPAKPGKKYFCPKCPHSSGKSKYIKVHMRTHSDNESHKCFSCPFITDNKFSLKKHMTNHRGATKAYGCPECSYETDNRTKCRRHILIHKDESEVKINKCSLCPFRTKHKHNLVTHQLVHLNPKEIPMYKCAKCEYETKYKSSLVVHLKKHQDPDIVNSA